MKSSHCLPTNVQIPTAKATLQYFLTRKRPRRSPYDVPLSSTPREESFTFGVVTDIQYAHLPTSRGVTRIDTPTGTKYFRRRRAWKEVLTKLRSACHAFNKADVDFVVNLGDIIEGFHDLTRTRADLHAVLSTFSSLRPPLWHVVGNHCRALPNRELNRLLRLNSLFYTREIAPGWRCIMLNTSQICETAVDSAPGDKNALRRFVHNAGRDQHSFHGGVGNDQLQWLSKVLKIAEDRGERVIILSHYPLCEHAARKSHTLANSQQVREIIERDGSPVKLCLAGHDHIGGFHCAQETDGRSAIAYITLPAMLEAAHGRNAFAFVAGFSDGSFKVFNGFDSSLIYAFDSCVETGRKQLSIDN